MALVLAMSHCKKQAWYEYWAVDEIVDNPLFRKYMTKQRFGQILQFLHFEDNNNASDQTDFGKSGMYLQNSLLIFPNSINLIKIW